MIYFIVAKGWMRCEFGKLLQIKIPHYNAKTPKDPEIAPIMALGHNPRKKGIHL